MTNTTAQDFVGRHFRDEDGVVFRIEGYNKGWFTSTTADGVEQKDRLADIEPLLLSAEYDPAEEQEEGADGTKMAKQLAKYRANYAIGIAPSGRKSLNNGDAIATALEMMDLPELYAVVQEIFELDLRDKYAHLNKGAQRMNLGNRLRSAYKKEDHKHNAAVVAWVIKQCDNKDA